MLQHSGKGDGGISKKLTTCTTSVVELQKYLEEAHEENKFPPNYWKEHQSAYPTLAVLMKTVLGVPASSAGCSCLLGRLFRIAGKVFDPDRCRLTDATFEKLMFIRCNIEYFV